MHITVGSYNVRGLRVGHGEVDKARRLVVNELLETCDILCIQETFLAKQDLEKLNSIHSDFYGAGESTTDCSTRILRGRIPGGVALLWHKKYDQLIKVVRLNDWAIGLEFCSGDKKFTILNIYTPYECPDNEYEYLSRLAYVNAFIQDNVSCSIFIMGDLNADISDHGSLFANHLKHFCSDSGISLSSETLLPKNSFTYISEAWHTTSWLDHCLCTSDAHNSIVSFKVNYEFATYDHVPFSMSIKVSSVPSLVPANNDTHVGNINWSSLAQQDICNYSFRSEYMLSRIELPKSAVACNDFNCKSMEHKAELCSLYNMIVDSLLDSSQTLNKNKLYKAKPGWNEYVKEFHTEARRAFKAWVETGKPKHGPIFECMKKASSNFKYALRFIRRNENILRADSLAKKLQSNSSIDFWKEIKRLNSYRASLPTNIDGISGAEQITNLWRKHYNDIFNTVKSNDFLVGDIDKSEHVFVSPLEVYEIVMKLDNNKACGADKITTEHLKYASKKLFPLLSICFNGFLIHGVLPDTLLSVILVPIVKDKAGKINSKENYRPIALASTLSKVLV